MKDFPFEDAIYWGYFSDKKMYSLRRHSDHILMIGCPHKVGQADSESYYQDLREKFLKLNISDESSETIEWSGQHFRSSDELPFIGEGFEKDTLMGTGFATDGLVYGTLSAMIFKDILLNNKNAYKDLFKPHRARSIGSKKFITENLNVLEQYVVDYLKSSSTEHPEAGEGKVLSYKGGKYAVTKDEQGEIQVCSAVCTHLGCIVHWNSAEKSWDCPCHGSRFNHKGETLEGPALKDLGEKLKEDIL